MDKTIDPCLLSHCDLVFSTTHLPYVCLKLFFVSPCLARRNFCKLNEEVFPLELDREMNCSRRNELFT